MALKNYKVYDNKNKAVLNAYEMLSANIYIGDTFNKIKTVALTSCNPKEGKTSLAINLANTMAHSGLRVLLIDADMRKPNVAKRLNEGYGLGLSDYISTDMELKDLLSETNMPNLTYLPSGKENSSPIGLLRSEKFEELVKKVRNEYDFVIFDTPSLASVIDGAFIASKVDATIMVVKMGSTDLVHLKRFYDLLESLGAKMLGTIMNKVKRRDYKKYFKSYNYFLDTSRLLKQKSNFKSSSLNNNSKSI